MSFFEWLLNLSEASKKDSKDTQNDNGLTEEEQKLVDEGTYDSWNFEEEDTEEDDYYNEDED